VDRSWFASSCSLQLVKQAHLKKPLQARKVACFLGEMHDYLGDKVQLLKLPVPLIWFFALAANLVLSSASEWTPILANLALSPLAI